MMDRVVIALLTGSAVFGTLLFGELNDAADQPTVLPTAARTEPLPAPAAPRARVEELVETVLAHPLFSATRRPPEQAKTGPPADPGMGNLRLTGIIIEADRHLAVFAVPGAKPLARSEGEAVNEWHLDSISLREVSLSGPGGFMTLEPKSDPTMVRSTQAARPVVSPTQPSAIGGRPPSPVAAAPQAKPPPRTPGTAGPPPAASSPRARQ
jgi:hypothetical protein